MNVFCLVCTFWWFMCMTKWDFYSCFFLLPICFVGGRERKRRRFVVKILALKTCQLGLMIKGGCCYYIRVGRVLCFDLRFLMMFEWMNSQSLKFTYCNFPCEVVVWMAVMMVGLIVAWLPKLRFFFALGFLDSESWTSLVERWLGRKERETVWVDRLLVGWTKSGYLLQRLWESGYWADL